MTSTARYQYHRPPGLNLQGKVQTGEFAVLFSHWSDSTNGQLPCFPSVADARNWAIVVTLAQPGITYTLLHRPAGKREWFGEDGRIMADHQYRFQTGHWPSSAMAPISSMEVHDNGRISGH